MNLGEFHDRVKAAIKRGDSLDALIPFWVSEAARLLEQNYTFSWMERTTDITIAAGNVPLSYALNALVKSVNWIKPKLSTNTDGTEWYGEALVGVASERITGLNGGNPAGYWLEGTDGTYSIKFDAIPHAEWKAKMSWNIYTSWPVLDNATPALLLRGSYALFCQTLILFANEMKDSRMVEQYGGLLQGALNTLLRSEEELKLSHQNDIRMRYQGLK